MPKCRQELSFLQVTKEGNSRCWLVTDEKNILLFASHFNGKTLPFTEPHIPNFGKNLRFNAGLILSEPTMAVGEWHGGRRQAGALWRVSLSDGSLLAQSESGRRQRRRRRLHLLHFRCPLSRSVGRTPAALPARSLHLWSLNRVPRNNCEILLRQSRERTTYTEKGIIISPRGGTKGGLRGPPWNSSSYFSALSQSIPGSIPGFIPVYFSGHCNNQQHALPSEEHLGPSLFLLLARSHLSFTAISSTKLMRLRPPMIGGLRPTDSSLLFI